MFCNFLNKLHTMGPQLHSTFKFFSSPFHDDCEKVPLQIQMKLIDFQCSENFACHIFDFNKNHVLSNLDNSLTSSPTPSK